MKKLLIVASLLASPMSFANVIGVEPFECTNLTMNDTVTQLVSDGHEVYVAHQDDTDEVFGLTKSDNDYFQAVSYDNASKIIVGHRVSKTQFEISVLMDKGDCWATDVYECI